MRSFTPLRIAVVAGASAVAALGIALASPAPAQAGIDTSRTYRITTSNSLALDVEGSSKANGARVIQWPITNTANQRWRFKLVEAGQYYVVSVNSGKCLAIDGNSPYAGAGLVQNDCGYWTRWSVSSPWGDATIRLDSNTGFSADVPNGSASWGTQLIQWGTSIWAPHQAFALTPIDKVDPNRTYRITTSNSLALDVEGGSTANDARVIQWPINGGTNQQWRFVPSADGSQSVVNVKSGKCLSVYYNRYTAGTPLVQYDCYGWANQRWWIETPWDAGDLLLKLRSASSGLYVDVPGGTASWGTQLIQWYGNILAPNQQFALTVLY